MNLKHIAFFMILLFIIGIPTAYAQISIGEKAEQKSVQVVINSSNEIHVKHVIASSNTPKQVNLIDGERTNLKVSDELGNEIQFGDSGGSIIIFPSQNKTIIEYDLGNVLFLKNNMLTWDFKYLQTTSFIVPEEVDLLFVNNRPVKLDEKLGITCHGCQMLLEYSLNMPKILKNVQIADKKFVIEIGTFAEINKFNFNQDTKSINFQVNGDKQIVTLVIPQELLSGPYNVFLGDKKIAFSEYINNGTHVWLNMRPDNSGDISITSTTDIGMQKPTMQDNSSKVNPSIVTGFKNTTVYIIIGVIIAIGLATAIIIMKKKKSDLSSEIDDNKLEN
ncbi:conserved exported hypothetical protein [metagenome]